MINKEVVKYILGILCNSADESIISRVHYGKDNCGQENTVSIQQSNFFDAGFYGTPESDPALPLTLLEGVPVLFGEPTIVKQESRIIINADLIASTYYLISRYEEMIKPDIRDQHGRFPGKESLPYRAGFIERPIVEEYGKILRNCLREIGVDVKEIQPGFSHIYLTHDVDCPWEHFTLYTACKRIVREIIRGRRLTIYPLKNILGKPECDPWYTFEAMIVADKSVPSAESIYFIVSTGFLPPQDYYPYIRNKGTKKLLTLLNNSGAYLGYHVSYAAGRNTDLISEELNTLKVICCEDINMSRNHYLAALEPRDYNVLIENGITDDFTMGYADVAGFRLGTCKAVQWIDPERMSITQLTLHPLTMMDRSLTADKYMGLNEQKAQEYGKKLIEVTKSYGGELSLLWHNNTFTADRDSTDWNNYNFFLQLLKKYD